ncbi:MAG: putative Phosphoglycolate phosphatase [Chloroflexi bacterium]|jgi:HAD superfamily hydrolase (TIGR01549 family)|nr:putative Phosphoglycolate phosphatase [Chloroflexota bacterium]
MAHAVSRAGGAPALLFDVDGTLVDSVYQHVLAWHEALQEERIELSIWRIHRRVGMSGGLFVDALARETGTAIDAARAERMQRRHAQEVLARLPGIRPLRGAIALLQRLHELGVAFALATSGRRETADHTIGLLGLPPGVPVVTRDDVAHAKPDPDLFLAAADRLGVPAHSCFVVGDSVWDLLAAQRARALGVGLLSGGYGRSELDRAGAYRVYEDPADLLAHLDEIGVRGA